MNTEIELKKIIGILTEQLKTIIEIKSEFIDLKNYEKVAVFRDLEKQIENCLDLLDANELKKEKKQKINVSELEKTSNSNFSIELTKILDSIDQPIFTNKIVVSILERLNIVSDIILGLNINLTDLRTELTSITINDFLPNHSPLISHKSLKVFKTSFLEAKHLGENEVSTSILFLSILRNETDITTKILKKNGIDYDSFLSLLTKKSYAQQRV